MFLRFVHFWINTRTSLTPESSTQDLCVEPLLVLADLRCVIGGACVGGIDIHHGSFPHLHLQLLKPGA